MTAPSQAEPDPAARGSALLFWAQLAGNSGLFVALVLITRALGPSGRGTIAFITVAAILLARIARLGVSEATTVFTAQRPAARPALLTNLVLSAGTCTAIGASLVCGALAALPASVRPSGIGTEELVLLGLGALASAFADAGYTFLLGCSRFRLHALTTAVTAWLYVALVVVVEGTVGLTIASAALAWIAVQGLKGLFMLAVSARDVGLGAPDGALFGEAIRFGVRAWFGTLSDALNDRLDQIIVAFIASQAVLGFYAVAVNSSEILLYLPGAAATAVLPVAAASRPGRKSRRRAARLSVRAVGLPRERRGRGGPRPAAHSARLRRGLFRVRHPVPAPPPRRTRLRRSEHLHERARRFWGPGPIIAGPARVACRSDRARFSLDSPVWGVRRGGSSVDRVSGGRRHRARPLPSLGSLLVADAPTPPAWRSGPPSGSRGASRQAHSVPDAEAVGPRARLCTRPRALGVVEGERRDLALGVPGRWGDHYVDWLGEHGLTPEWIREQAAIHSAAAPTRAFALFDAWWARAREPA